MKLVGERQVGVEYTQLSYTCNVGGQVLRTPEHPSRHWRAPAKLVTLCGRACYGQPSWRQIISSSPNIATHASRVIVRQFDYRLDYAVGTLQGTDRVVNEDAAEVQRQPAIFAIADGMGGHRAGHVASALAVAAVIEAISTADSRAIFAAYVAAPEPETRRKVFRVLVEALRFAHSRIQDAAGNDPETAGMGTTLDVLVLLCDRAFLAHVGDSRAYLARPKATLQLTHDHAGFDSLEDSVKRDTSIPRPLTNSLGHGDVIEVDTLSVQVTTGDRIVLVTDGAYNALPTEAMLGRACRNGDVVGACEAILGAAAKRAKRDDATALVVEIGERFVRRSRDVGRRRDELKTLSTSSLLSSLTESEATVALGAGVEVEYPAGVSIPRVVANDRVAYLIVDGTVEVSDGRVLGPGAFLMPESLVDVTQREDAPVAQTLVRLHRIRRDDFREVCSTDDKLAAKLYRAIARHIALSLR